MAEMIITPPRLAFQVCPCVACPSTTLSAELATMVAATRRLHHPAYHRHFRATSHPMFRVKRHRYCQAPLLRYCPPQIPRHPALRRSCRAAFHQAHLRILHHWHRPQILRHPDLRRKHQVKPHPARRQRCRAIVPRRRPPLILPWNQVALRVYRMHLRRGRPRLQGVPRRDHQQNCLHPVHQASLL